MASTQDKPMQAPTTPLNVKEQLEATASRFKAALIRNNDDDDATNRTSCNNPNGIQVMLNTMFASCTMGNNFDTDSLGSSPSMLKNSDLSRTVNTSALTPSSSNGETSSPAQVTPSPLHQKTMGVKAELLESSKALFKSNHEIAQEAIHRLRKQHQLEQSEKLVSDSLYESEVAVDTERYSLVSARSSMFSNNPSTLSFNPSTLTNNRTLSTFDAEESQVRKASLQKLLANRAKQNAKVAEKPEVYKFQEHSFFPASSPDAPGRTRKEKRVREKLMRNKGVPKEVTSASPMRMLKNRNNQRQKRLLNSTPNGKNNLFNDDFNAQCEANANDSWDIENDGISDITQSTVDRMVLALAQHVRVFPEEAEALNRIHSDVTDPAPKNGALRSIKETQADYSFPILSGNPGFSTGALQTTKQRTYGSTGTQSFFTKTTHSTQTNDFANAWKIDEQNFWDTEVAKERFKTPTKQRKNRRGESSTITTATTPTTLFTSPQTPPSFFREEEITFPNEFAEI